MANFSVTIAVLFCFFTLSFAPTPLNTPGNDDVATAVSHLLPESSPATTSDQSVPVNAHDTEMLVSSGENSEFQDPEALHCGSWKRVKLHRHHHHDEDTDSDSDEDSDSDSDSDDEDEDDRIKKMALERRNFGGFDAEKKLKILKKHFRHENAEEEEHHHKKEGDGFLIRVRKVFDHYF